MSVNRQLQSQTGFTGTVVFISHNNDAPERDTVEYFFSSSRILLVDKTNHNKKRQSTRRIVDIATGKEYFINDREKVALEKEVTNEYPTRNFINVNRSERVLGYNCTVYSSEMTTVSPTSNKESNYKLKISVSDSLSIGNIPEDLYLVNFKVFKGKLILGYEGEYYFGDGLETSKAFSKMISIIPKSHPADLFEIGKNYTVEEYSKERYFKLFLELDEDEVQETLRKKGF